MFVDVGKCARDSNALLIMNKFYFYGFFWGGMGGMKGETQSILD